MNQGQETQFSHTMMESLPSLTLWTHPSATKKEKQELLEIIVSCLSKESGNSIFGKPRNDLESIFSKMTTDVVGESNQEVKKKFFFLDSPSFKIAWRKKSDVILDRKLNLLSDIVKFIVHCCTELERENKNIPVEILNIYDPFKTSAGLFQQAKNMFSETIQRISFCQLLLALAQLADQLDKKGSCEYFTKEFASFLDTYLLTTTNYSYGKPVAHYVALLNAIGLCMTDDGQCAEEKKGICRQLIILHITGNEKMKTVVTQHSLLKRTLIGMNKSLSEFVTARWAPDDIFEKAKLEEEISFWTGGEPKLGDDEIADHILIYPEGHDQANMELVAEAAAASNERFYTAKHSNSHPQAAVAVPGNKEEKASLPCVKVTTKEGRERKRVRGGNGSGDKYRDDEGSHAWVSLAAIHTACDLGDELLNKLGNVEGPGIEDIIDEFRVKFNNLRSSHALATPSADLTSLERGCASVAALEPIVPSFCGLTSTTNQTESTHSTGQSNGKTSEATLKKSDISPSSALEMVLTLSSSMSRLANNGLSIPLDGFVECFRRIKDGEMGGPFQGMRQILAANWPKDEEWNPRKRPEEKDFTDKDVYRALTGGKFKEEDLEILRGRGDGSYGSVFEVRCKAHPSKRAMLKYVSFDGVGNLVKWGTREVVHGSKVKSPNLVRYLGFMPLPSVAKANNDKIPVGILMEVCRHDLDPIASWLNSDRTSIRILKKEKFALVLNIMIQVLRGVRDLHSGNIYHRDIKIDNICIGMDGLVKIVDLGIAVEKKTDEKFDEVEGTYEYLPPEQAGPKHDFFSAATVWHELMTGVMPDWDKSGEPWVLAKAESVKQTFTIDGKDEMFNIFMHLSEPNEEERWTDKEAIPPMEDFLVSLGKVPGGRIPDIFSSG